MAFDEAILERSASQAVVGGASGCPGAFTPELAAPACPRAGAVFFWPALFWPCASRTNDPGAGNGIAPGRQPCGRFSSGRAWGAMSRKRDSTSAHMLGSNAGRASLLKKKTPLRWNKKNCSLCNGAKERSPGFAHIRAGWQQGIRTVVGRQYVKRQATFLLKFAQTTSDPQVAAALVEKAADLKARLDQSDKPDPSPHAPDVEPPTP